MAMIHCKECGAEISKSAKTCPNCGKKQKGSALKGILIAILVVIILGIIAGLGDNGGSTNSNSNSKVQPTEKFTLVSSDMYSDGFGTYVEGTIQNNTDKDYSYVQVTFNMYDENGNQLGTAIDNINNLKANGTWKYKAIGLTSENVASYEFVEISGW